VTKENLRRADLVFGLCLITFSILLLNGAYKLIARTLDRGRFWYQSAGLFPSIVGVLLLLCSILLVVRALKDGAKFDYLTKEKIMVFIRSKKTHVTSFVVVWLGVYIFVLLPMEFLHYSIATFIYLLVFMMVFQKKDIKQLAKSIVISVFATLLLTYGFGQLAMIPLP